MNKSLVAVCRQTEGTTLKHPKTLKLEVEIELCGCPEFSTHMATFTFADTTGTIEEGGKEIGCVAAGLGCMIFLADEATKYRYVIDPRKLWAEFQKALHPEKPAEVPA